MTKAARFAASAPSVTSEPVSLSPDRAFVVHFYAASAGAGIEAGRAEHVRSGLTTHFGSWEQLAAFVASVVGGTTPTRDVTR